MYKKADTAKKKGAVTKTAPKKKVNSKKRKKIMKIVKWTTLALIDIATIIFLLLSPIFNVTAIEVVGNEQISSEEIISLSQITIGENTFKNSKSNIVKNIKENAYIDEVKVKRLWPTKIQITVTERQVKFMLPILNSYAYINSQGYILEISETPQDVPTIVNASTPDEDIVVGNRICVEDLKKLETVLKIVSICEENEVYEYITSIDIADTSNYKINMDEKNKIAYIGDSSNLTTKILYVKAIADAEEGKVGEIFVNGDLNSGFQPYFREEL